MINNYVIIFLSIRVFVTGRTWYNSETEAHWSITMPHLAGGWPGANRIGRPVTQPS